jgi:multidrug efflux pump
MKWTDIFIRRPVLAICVNLLLLLVGVISIHQLNVRQYPRSDSAAITVTTAYIGADADLVRGFITTPLERAIASADGIDYLESTSQQGRSTITARLRLNFPVNDALTQIQAKVAQVRNDLPPEAEAPVIEVENKDTQFAAIYLSFYSDVLEGNQITDYLVRVVQPKLSAIKGVQRADILGGRTFAMRIWLKPDKMSAYNLSPAEVRAKLAGNNSLSAIGNTKGSMIQVNLTANTDLRTREEFENLVLRREGDVLIRLRDVADVVLGAETYDDDVRFSGQRATFIGVYVLPNANSLDVVQEIRRQFLELQRQLPYTIKADIPYDSTKYIQDSIREVVKTLAETVAIVIVVIFLFIGSFRGVLVPIVAIPLSLVGACFLMLVFGFTINLLTLLAIVLAVGLVVDDAIVMLENVERHISEGLPPIDAAIRGARELVAPTISMTLTLAVVYAPIGFQGGLTGALFKEFAFTLAGAVVISGLVALTLSPMMSSRLLKPVHNPNGFQALLDRLFNRLRDSYRKRLDYSLNFVPVTIVMAVLVMMLAVPFWMFSGKTLAPKEDQGVVFSVIQADPNATLDQVQLYASKVEEVFRTFPERDQTFQVTRPEGGFAGMVTKPWSERTRTTMQIETEAFQKLSLIPGVRALAFTPPPLPGGSDFPVEFVLTGTADPAQLNEYAQQLVARAFESGLFIYADSDLKYDLPQAEIVLDRDKVAALGLDLQQISNDLGSILGGNYINRFNILGRSYKVIAQAKRTSRLNPDQLSDIFVTGPDGTLVPLSTFATIEDKVQPRSLNRFQQLNSAKIQGLLPPPVSIDQALRFLEDEAAKILPPGFGVDYAGESRQLRTEGNTLLFTLGIAMILIYLVLAAQFESFRDPFIILLGSVPLAFTGALLITFLGIKDATINIYTQVGLITLIGLVSKNGILIVEFANSLINEGLSKREAIVRAAATRFRPILMTTVATVVGHMPLIFVTGAGAAARNNIGIVLVTGMAIGTFFTLFVVPSIYLVVSSGKPRGHHPTPPPLPSSPTLARNHGHPEEAVLVK